MINVQFFPSKWAALYLGRTFLLRSLAVLVALVLILQTLDLLGESAKILAVHGNGDAALWRYVGLRLPQLISRFIPYSVLLGTLITLATMNQNSEVVALKAAGISAHQIIAPLVLVSALLALGAFAFQERVETRATAALNAWQAVDYGPVPHATGVSSNVWVRDGADLIFAKAVTGSGAATRLTDVTIYDRTGGTLGRLITAGSGRPAPGGGWQLQNVRSFDVTRSTEMRAPSLVFGSNLTPERFTLADPQAEEQDLPTLRTTINALDQSGRPTGPLKAGLWHKISAPLSCVLMPLLAAIAAFGLARSGQLFVRAVIGMALGFAYFVADAFALAMGNFGAYPPLLAAWAPFVLFLLIGEAVLIRTEE